jgi:hypothetical protein
LPRGNYREAVLSKLDYVPYRTMSCRAVTRFAVNANSWMDGT